MPVYMERLRLRQICETEIQNYAVIIGTVSGTANKQVTSSSHS